MTVAWRVVPSTPKVLAKHAAGDGAEDIFEELLALLLAGDKNRIERPGNHQTLRADSWLARPSAIMVRAAGRALLCFSQPAHLATSTKGLASVRSWRTGLMLLPASASAQ